MIWKQWSNGQKYNIDEFLRLNSNYKQLAEQINAAYLTSLSVATTPSEGFKTIAWQDLIQQMQEDLKTLGGQRWHIDSRQINYLNETNINYWENKGKHIEESIQAFNQSIKYSGYAVSGVEYIWQL